MKFPNNPVRVYLSGPITGKYAENTTEAIALGRRLIELGYTPYVPHLSVSYPDQDSILWEDWLQICLPWVAVSQVLFRMNGESKGADREVAYARANDVPVVYSLEELEVIRREYLSPQEGSERQHEIEFK